MEASIFRDAPVTTGFEAEVRDQIVCDQYGKIRLTLLSFAGVHACGRGTQFLNWQGTGRVPPTHDSVFADTAPFRIEPRFVGRVWGWKDLRPWYDRTAKDEPIGKVMPRTLQDRTVLVESEYFCVEKIPVEVSRSSTSLPREDEPHRSLAFLFAAAGSGRLASSSFTAVDLPARGIVAIPAASPVFAIQDAGELDLIRITPRWPGKSA